ncbi:MAG: PEP/pyruvate-binding domain-containing protein [Corynebacterium sp.]|uniref:PEP/pyruvate-binding domain-containing protein n=1 Tax=Corynebacterium sp. TaxID=1720 RepID=UPI0026DA892D|nr:PEP/pyruvate-binding domain-containing protein [Corynebacterium sp.]MDO5099591.1 PEP/pyruvate-binding domain-containing protein [Corynebacterium sp.]
MIVWFDSVSAKDIALVGGKGANLGECVSAGFPVPPGFCISTAAYREAIAPVMTDVLAASAAGDFDRARNIIEQCEIPDKLRQDISAAYRELGEPVVAVRSSATVEDLADASFAGQQDTFLGVRGDAALMDAIRRCWSSLWTPRAVDYRAQKGIDQADLALSVVVQTMIPAETSGVLFTVNPMSDALDEMLVSASYGLGESVVASLVTPDTWVVSTKPSVQVRSVELGSKETRIDLSDDGGTETTEVSAADRSRLCVSAQELEALVRLGQKVEAHYGSGQDIEWAVYQGEVFLLQSRPITTVADAQITGHQGVHSKTTRTLRDDLVEHYPAPYPLDLLAVHAVQGAVHQAMNTIGLVPAQAEDLIVGDADGVIRLNVVVPRPALNLGVRLPRAFVRGMRHDPRAWNHERDVWLGQIAELETRSRGLDAQDDAEVIDFVRDAVAVAASVTTDRFLQYLAPMMVYRSVVTRLLAWSQPGAQCTAEDMVQGLDYVSAQVTREVQQLVQLARDTSVADCVKETDPKQIMTELARLPEGTRFSQAVREFLATYGARTGKMYLPFSNRSWGEYPEILLALIASQLRGGGEVATEVPDNLIEKVGAGLPKALRRLWRRTVERFRLAHIAREETAHFIEKIFVLARVGTDELGARLVRRGCISDAGDVQFLYFSEIVEKLLGDSTANLYQVVENRRMKRPTAEAIWWDRGEDTHASDSRIIGVGASAGRVIGTARIITGTADFQRLQPGDILVCPYTDPTWTPLFSVAAGVVADTGGPLSHAAIVAREYRIPAVLGTGRGTTLIRDGAKITIDGKHGWVEIMEEA